MSDNFLDQDFDQEDSVSFDPPVIQWRHGTGDPNHPELLASGGFEAPVERFGEIAGMKVYKVPHKNKVIESYIFNPASFAILAVGKKQWFTYEGDRRLYLPENFERVPGMDLSSRLRLFAISKELMIPVLITFSGTSSKHFFPILDTFKQQIIQGATRMKAKQTGKAAAPYPLYFFWLQVKAGPHETFSKGGWATQPVFATSDTTDKGITSLYVGSEVLAMVDAYKGAAKVWQEREIAFAKTGSAGMGGSNGHTMPEEPPVFEPAPDSVLSEDEIPF